ncbi:MAG: MlaD family protein [Sulfuricurvum sp.]|uniref:MlaD family protein n=1 Tax=Sulfuricurvum sp. TaxID=2025608 RepID=UPI00260A6F22|nr:MlaD family protein [Sulfuricurvum sp.]MDD2828876.1 MlaD family protein [Sulfuricurvum sp.]MDD4948539.1 MlaD family protein [Sulfuricurvum sp.]
MESKVNYTIVGVFVLFFTIAMVIFVFWLGKYNDDDNEYQRFKVYITESVSGLAPEASVKFHGVDVGQVESIQINPQNSEEVVLILKIKKTAPIKNDSTAMLKFFGITGLAFIEIAGGAKNAPLLQTSDKNISVIPTSPSLIKRLDETLSSVVTKFSYTLDKTNAILNDKNAQNFSQTLANLKNISIQMADYQDEIDILLKNSIQTGKNMDDMMARVGKSSDTVNDSMATFRTTMKDSFGPSMNAWKETSKKTNALIETIQSSMARGDYDIQTSTQELNALLAQSRATLVEMEQTLKTLKESPSDILFKTSNPTPGPGEK